MPETLCKVYARMLPKQQECIYSDLMSGRSWSASSLGCSRTLWRSTKASPLASLWRTVPSTRQRESNRGTRWVLCSSRLGCCPSAKLSKVTTASAYLDDIGVASTCPVACLEAEERVAALGAAVGLTPQPTKTERLIGKDQREPQSTVLPEDTPETALARRAQEADWVERITIAKIPIGVGDERRTKVRQRFADWREKAKISEMARDCSSHELKLQHLMLMARMS